MLFASDVQHSVDPRRQGYNGLVEIKLQPVKSVRSRPDAPSRQPNQTWPGLGVQLLDHSTA
jgi:hypothetical protein